jgi:hypothetical protein
VADLAALRHSSDDIPEDAAPAALGEEQHQPIEQSSLQDQPPGIDAGAGGPHLDESLNSHFRDFSCRLLISDKNKLDFRQGQRENISMRGSKSASEGGLLGFVDFQVPITGIVRP